MTLRRAAVLVASAVLAAAAAWVASRPEAFWFDTPETALAKAEARFRAELLATNGMAALWSFDDRDAGGWFVGSVCTGASASGPGGWSSTFSACPGTELVPGRHGGARRFSGDGDCAILSPFHWIHGESEPLTVALWVRLKPRPGRQDLLCTAERALWGLRADGDRICFDFQTPDGPETLSAPFPRTERWTHLAAVADPRPEGGRVLLYVDGAVRAEAPLPALAAFDWPIAFGAATGLRTRDAPRGDMDDAALWNRALSGTEIRAAARSSKGLAETFSTPRSRARLARARRRAAVRSHLGRALSLFAVPRIPGAHSSAEPSAAEAVSLRFGRGDLRRLLRTHARVLRSGCLPDGAPRSVAAILTMRGVTVRCRVSILGDALFAPDSARPALAVDPAEPGATLPGGARRLVLAPPEACGGLFPLAGALAAEASGLPLASGCSVASLRVDGRDHGLRLLLDHSRMGGDSALDPPVEVWRFAGGEVMAAAERRRRFDPGAFPPGFEGAVRAFLSPEARAGISVRLRAEAARFARDAGSPLPPRRRERLLVRAAEAWDAMPDGPPDPADVPLDAALFAGGNVSPFRVVRDLPLEAAAAAAASVPGCSLRFRGLAPDRLDGSGRIVRRPASAPAEAPVEAVWRGPDGAERSETLRFRVMPERLALPTLAIRTGFRLGRFARADAVAEWYEPGAAEDGPARILPGTFAGGGGLRFRGNTGFLTPRKSLSFRADSPVGIFGDGAGRVFAVSGGLSDRTLSANAFAFGLFRDLPRGGAEPWPAPRVRRAEVFLDGRYAGLRECIERIDGDLPGCAGSVFFRHSVVKPAIPFMRPVHAPSRDAEEEAVAALGEALSLVAGETEAGWPERVEARIDLDAAVDLFLLSDLLGNMNGHPKSFPFDEVLRFDPETSRFSFVPWDFDQTLRNDRVSVGTDSDRVFVRALPGYRARVAARWRELRAGPCATESLLARYDALWRETEGWLRFDEKLWNPGNPDPEASLESRWRESRDILVGRAERLDREWLSPESDRKAAAAADPR